MIILRTRFVTIGEALFGEPAEGARVDLVRHTQRRDAIANAACTSFATIQIDLRADEVALLAAIKKGTRYEIRRAETDGVQCEVAALTELARFSEFFASFAEIKGISTLPDAQLEAYAQQGALRLTRARSADGEVLVWHAYLIGNKRARLLLSATSERGDDKAKRAAIGRANRLLHWHDIKTFRAAGLGIYDLGGWQGESPDPELRGISKFKREFGGAIVEEANCVEAKTLRGKLYLRAEALVAKLRTRRASPVPLAPISLLRCPDDAGELVLRDAHLQCSSCSERYPVEDNIVRFVKADELDSEEKRSEMHARDQEAERYDERFSAVRNAIEIPTSLTALSPTADDVVAELGCGSGRMTLRYLETVRAVIAIDFSLASLRVLQRKLPPHLRARVLLVQADICRPPLVASSFSKVASFQVFEHLPTPEMRAAAFRAARKLLRPTGTFTLSVYNWNWNKQRLSARGIGDNTAKEGFHAGANRVYYFNFEPHDLAALFAQSGFQVDLMTGLDAQVPGIDRVGFAAVAVNRLLERLPLGRRLGHLLLARGSVRV